MTALYPWESAGPIFPAYVMAEREYPAHMVMADYMKALTMGSATVIMDPSVAALLKDSLWF